MERQRRWFWGTLLTAFLVTVGLGVYPWVSSALTITSPVSQKPQSEIMSSGDSMAQAGTPEAPESAVFRDPAGQYEIALLPGYQIYGSATTSVIEAPDGSLAYTTVLVPTFDSGVQLTDAGLAQLARETFQRGEGFITQEFQPIQSGIKVNWQGSVTTRGAQQLSGSIFARQEGDRVALLMIAATDAGQEALAGAIATLPPSLQLLNP
ncbi:MAG: hypothetical protein F6K30_02535 [Cyanothece sp. SIO2G6]|nr:hypothetical protein [Cyanothece sp. SIO2G6]